MQEVDTTSVHDDFNAHWVVAPVSRVDTLSHDVKTQNNWLMEQYPGIDYFEGKFTIKLLHKTLQDIGKKMSNIDVRGKKKWLIN